MGSFRVPLQVANLNSEPAGPSETVAALVDTGATFSMIPASILHRLGVKPAGALPFRIASGEVVDYIVGDALFTVEGRAGPAGVIFGPENHYIMGSTTMERLLLTVDPIRECLVPAEGYQ